DYPHIALGANYLYLTVNHFTAGAFARSTIARLPLTEIRRNVPFTFQFFTGSASEFTFKAAHDYGPSTRIYFATHVNNTTLRIYRWEEQEDSPVANNISIPAWTRGTKGDFICTTPDRRNPCARLDDRLLGGFVASGKNLPAAATAKKIVGFSWTARQGGSFPMPYTNIVRIDADSLTPIDNPALWSGVNAF